MSTTTLKPLYDAISEAKKGDLRRPWPAKRALDGQQIKKRLAQIIPRGKHSEELDEYAVAVLEALILRMLVEKMHEDSSGLDKKLHRYTKTLCRKLL